MVNAIPIVDCGGKPVETKATQIYEAIETIGFVYLKNFGFDFKKITDLNERMLNNFWNLPEKEKQKFSRGVFEVDEEHGYVGSNDEHLTELTEQRQHLTTAEKSDLKNAEEIREAFDVAGYQTDDSVGSIKLYPANAGPQIRELYSECRQLALDLIAILSKQIFPKDPKKLLEFHQHIGDNKLNSTQLRILYYPPIPHTIKAGAERLGEHSDYGTVTLLFQDEVGGLEIRDRNGNFMPATPEKDAVLVNLADLMQRWTGDRLKAVRHRVRVPDDRRCWTNVRQSIVFFADPDMKTMVESDKYETVQAGQYIKNKFYLTKEQNNGN